MAEVYWIGLTSSDPTDVNNWSDTDGGATPASGVPGTGDNANFTGNGNNPCTLTANWPLANLTTLAGYTATIDDAIYDLTMDDGGSVILDHAGTFDAGSGTISVTNGTFDYEDVGTWIRGTSTVVLGGSGILRGDSGSSVRYLSNLTFAANSNYSVVSRSGFRGLLLLEVGATVDIATGMFLLTSPGEVQIQAGATISRTGDGFFYLWDMDLTQQDGEISAECRVHGNSSLVGGNYSGLLWFRETSTNNRIQTITGAFTAGRLEFETKSTGNILLDATGLTAMNVAAEMTVDINGTGDFTVDNTGNSAAWDFKGDIVNQITGAGIFTWTKGLGTITASGAADQTWDWMGQSIEALTVDKSAGALAIADVTTELQAVDMVGNLTITGSTITSSADAKSIIGDFNVSDAGNDIHLGSATWTITDGEFDYTDVGTLIRGSSTIVMAGTGSIAGVAVAFLNKLTIEGTTTTPGQIYPLGAVTINGTLSLDGPVYAKNDTTIGVNGRLTGNGIYFVLDSPAGKGISSFASGGVVDVAELNLRRFNTNAVFAPGIYGSPLTTVSLTTVAAHTLSLSATPSTPYVFTGNLKFYNKVAGGSLAIANGTNDPDITLHGDVIWDQQAGTITYTRGGGLLTFAGANPQNIDFGGQPVEAVVINKSAGTLTLASTLDCVSLTGTSGQLDINAKTLASDSSISLAAGFLISDLAGATIQCDTFTADGQDFAASGAWILTAATSGTISNAAIANCDASGGATINATDNCTDGGGNQNIVFFARALVNQSLAQGRGSLIA